MKANKLKCFVVACIIVITSSSSVFVSAENIEFTEKSMENTSNVDYNIVSEYAQKILSQMGRISGVSRPIPLYNINGELVAVNFLIDTGGYIIVNTNDFSIPELSFENESPFTNVESNYIYNGPLVYFEEKGENLIDLSSGKLIDRSELYNVTSIYRNKIEDIQRINDELGGQNTIAASYDGEFKLSTPLKTWYKSGGYCGPIAASYVFMYYDKVRNEKFVSTSYENSGLIDLLIPYIDPDSNGSSTSELRSGMLKYMSAQGITGFTVASGNYGYTSIKARIKDFNTPVIVDTDNHPIYQEHWITSYGYFDNGIVDFLIVNDGWGNNGVYIDWGSGYYDDVVFVTP